MIIPLLIIAIFLVMVGQTNFGKAIWFEIIEWFHKNIRRK